MKKPSPSRQKQKANPSSSAVGHVRIIGGQFKRRNVSFIDADGLRPTPDRLRETLFNWLLADINDALVLDSCAGSGVLGFEALSRGAAHCTFIEANALQAEIIKQSAQQLRLPTDSYQLLTGQAQQLLVQDAELRFPFDIIFIDPPYAQDLWQPILMALIEQQLITPTSLIYLEADKDLSEALDALTLTLKLAQNPITAGFLGFTCLKHTKVGQVVAGLYQLASS